MKKIIEFFKSPHIQIALTTGGCIIILAFVSKRLLPEPMGYAPLAIPPFLMTMYEYVVKRYSDKKLVTTWYWVLAIVGSTCILVIYYYIEVF